MDRALAFRPRSLEGTSQMTLDAFIPLPPPGFEVASEYRLTPRPKRARVYVDTQGETQVRLPGGTRRALEMVIYPDLNDLVRVGSTMARLAKPIMPKYHLWFEIEAPNRILRFEGPYGPPGAPELIMELVEDR